MGSAPENKFRVRSRLPVFIILSSNYSQSQLLRNQYPHPLLLQTMPNQRDYIYPEDIVSVRSRCLIVLIDRFEGNLQDAGRPSVSLASFQAFPDSCFHHWLTRQAVSNCRTNAQRWLAPALCSRLQSGIHLRRRNSQISSLFQTASKLFVESLCLCDYRSVLQRRNSRNVSGFERRF